LSNAYATIITVIVTLLTYIASNGRSPFDQWFAALDATAAAKVSDALDRVAAGHEGNLKPLGGGVHEVKIHVGPGYRVYFGRIGQTIILLLGGGTKRAQDRDIAQARDRWADYQRRR
jgi:putative addiction module killer protein